MLKDVPTETPVRDHGMTPPRPDSSIVGESNSGEGDGGGDSGRARAVCGGVTTVLGDGLVHMVTPQIRC
jgi:hypothetical protein